MEFVFRSTLPTNGLKYFEDYFNVIESLRIDKYIRRQMHFVQILICLSSIYCVQSYLFPPNKFYQKVFYDLIGQLELEESLKIMASVMMLMTYYCSHLIYFEPNIKVNYLIQKAILKKDHSIFVYEKFQNDWSFQLVTKRTMLIFYLFQAFLCISC